MQCRLRLFFFTWLVVLFVIPAAAQVQTCPFNINFASKDLSNWSAKTGLVGHGGLDYPAPNSGVSTIPEFSIPTTGIHVITNSFADPFGGFATVPVINGYSYGYSVQIGSIATSYDLHTTTREPGGFTRSVTYTIAVPAGPVSVPFTMTYAYAMVLENGTHNSNQQPLFKATLSTAGGIITCASPSYYLPTLNDASQGNGQGQGGSTGATLDSALAIANGFKVSPKSFLSHAGQQNDAGTLLQDVWTKGWTEVTFDLSPYRGQQVTLTFESDNCTPGAHFAYAYVALRNDCAGLQISGKPVACANTPTIYSVPALANGSYDWTVPAGWTVNSGANSNIINVTAGTGGGIITVHELNGCADLRDTMTVTTVPPTVAGRVISDSRVCAGTNNTLLTVGGQTGDILNWISSTDGINWTTIVNSTANLAAQNLGVTTQYRALVQNGSSCSIDSSAAAIITVDPKSKGGELSPSASSICLGQTSPSFITLTDNIGSVLNWQVSTDSVNWNDFTPVKTDEAYNANTINRTSYFRTIVKSGTCPADTGSVAVVRYINTPFPTATIDPKTAAICYGKNVQLNASITNGTAYTWTNAATLANAGNGVVAGHPYLIQAIASPLQTTDYVLTVTNDGCPNALMDTFHVSVAPPIIVFAGNDTSIVASQPLQLNAVSGDPLATQYLWMPSTGLDNSNLSNPIANLASIAGNSLIYTVRATRPDGCYGEDNIKVTVFTTAPDIFVPSGFTPNGDGKNDIIKPICVGITTLNFFRVYNRWGQLVFSTSEIGKGWDGSISGIPQATANFVYIAQGIDFTGKSISRKGNIVLIR